MRLLQTSLLGSHLLRFFPVWGLGQKTFSKFLGEWVAWETLTLLDSFISKRAHTHTQTWPGLWTEGKEGQGFATSGQSLMD